MAFGQKVPGRSLARATAPQDFPELQLTDVADRAPPHGEYRTNQGRHRAQIKACAVPGFDLHQAAAARGFSFAIAALTRGITSSAMSCIERLASFSSVQSMPA
jgi:hypothetical protein